MANHRRVPVTPAMPITSADGDDYMATMGDNEYKAGDADEADRTGKTDRAGNEDKAGKVGRNKSGKVKTEWSLIIKALLRKRNGLNGNRLAELLGIN